MAKDSQGTAVRRAEERTATIDAVLTSREYVDHLRVVFRRLWDGGYAAAELSSPEHAIATAARRYVALMEDLAPRDTGNYHAKREAYHALWQAVLDANAAEAAEEGMA